MLFEGKENISYTCLFLPSFCTTLVVSEMTYLSRNSFDFLFLRLRCQKGQTFCEWEEEYFLEIPRNLEVRFCCKSAYFSLQKHGEILEPIEINCDCSNLPSHLKHTLKGLGRGQENYNHNFSFHDP